MNQNLPATVPQSESMALSFASPTAFDHIQRVAKALTESQLVPATFQRNLPNCIVALEMAQRIGASPLMVMQNLNIIHGKPSFGASFMIAAANSCGRFTPLRFQYVGTEGDDSYGCYAVAKEKASGEECRGVTVTIGTAKSEGWFQKNGSKWKTMPGLMLQYRAATWWVRAFAPELLMGFQSTEEVIDLPTTPEAPAAGATTIADGAVPRRTRKGIAEMKAAEPVPAPEAPAAEQAAPEPAPAPAEQAAPAEPPPPPPPAQAELPADEPANKPLRCEVVTVTPTAKPGITELALKGDYTGVAYVATDKAPAEGSMVDVELIDVPSKSNPAVVLKKIKSLTVL